MQAKFICHPDFESVMPKNDVFHKEIDRRKMPPVERKYLNRHILFRKKVSLAKAESAVLRITADDYYKLYINGKFVTQGPAPSYPNSYYYNEIDVKDYLCEGGNVIAVHTYYQGLINRVWVSGDMREMMWCELFLDDECALVSDETWLCADHMGYSVMGKVGYDTAFLERYDSRASEAAFASPDFDDSSWMHASISAGADHVLKKQPSKQLMLYEIPFLDVKRTKGHIFADLGREVVGYPKITATGNAGDIVTIKLGEELNPDGTVRFDMRCNCRYEEEWILADGISTLSQYDYKAFRYMELDFPQTVSITEMGVTVRHYPCAEKAIYTTDNEDLKKILRLCADTVKYGAQEVFVDCPTREKGQYMGDVSVAARAHATLTQDTSFMKKAILDFCHSRFISEGLMAVSTSAYMQEIADYSLQFPAQICWVYAMDGDVEFLKEVHPYAEAVYEYFLRYVDETGLLNGVDEKWNLVDWPVNLRDGYDFPLTTPIGKGRHNVINAFWCGFIDSLDELRGYLSLAPTGRAKVTKDAFRASFYSEETGLYCDSEEKTHSAVHSNLLPLLFDIGTEDAALCERIVNLIEEKGLRSMGVYMAYFTLAALMKNGRRDLAEKLATDRDAWLLMLSEGATTTFEAWGKDQKTNCSLFHPWATAPLIVFADNTRIY